MFKAEYHQTKTYNTKVGAMFGMIINTIIGNKVKGSKTTEDKKIKVNYMKKFKIKI